MKDKVTVAVPVSNGEKYIDEALQSITNQTYKVDEILICDNKSTDSTIEIIERFIENHPETNIRLHKNEINIGADPNFNKCMELCDTKFLVILGSDDRLKPEAIEKQLRLFNKMPELGLIGGLFQAIDREGKTKSKIQKKETIIFRRGDILEFAKQTVFYMQHSTVMFNMECTRKVGFFDTRYIANDERLYVTHLLKYPIAQIGEVLAEARFHAGQETRDENARFKDKILHFKMNLGMAELESSPERILETKKILKKWVAGQCSLIGRRVTRGQHKPFIGLRYWLHGIRIYPASVFNKFFLQNIYHTFIK